MLNAIIKLVSKLKQPLFFENVERASPGVICPHKSTALGNVRSRLGLFLVKALDNPARTALWPPVAAFHTIQLHQGSLRLLLMFWIKEGDWVSIVLSVLHLPLNDVSRSSGTVGASAQCLARGFYCLMVVVHGDSWNDSTRMTVKRARAVLWTCKVQVRSGLRCPWR